jgi:hypothetical protein
VLVTEHPQSLAIRKSELKSQFKKKNDFLSRHIFPKKKRGLKSVRLLELRNVRGTISFIKKWLLR